MNSEETRLYRTMLQAHTERLGEPSPEQRRYLWGLAREVVAREELRLVYAVAQETSTYLPKEILDPHLAQDELAQRGDGWWIEARWKGRWAPVDPDRPIRPRAEPQNP